MQVPAPTKLTVEPETVQTPVVALVNVTALPDPPPVALTVYVAPATVALEGAVEVNAIDWPALAMANVCVTVAAAL